MTSIGTHSNGALMATPALFTTAHSPVSLHRRSTSLPACAMDAASVTSSITGMSSPVEDDSLVSSAALDSVRTPANTR